MPSTSFDVGRVGFEQVGGEPGDLLSDVGDGADHGTAGQRRGAAAAGPDQVERRHLGVAGDDADALERHSELVGGQLRQRGVVALAVGRLAGEDGQRAVGLEAGGRPLRAPGRGARAERPGVVRWTGRGLHERGEPEAPVAPRRPRLLLVAPGTRRDRRVPWRPRTSPAR